LNYLGREKRIKSTQWCHFRNVWR